MELEPSAEEVVPAPDPRPRMEELPPVKLVSVDDVRLDALRAVERELDIFYVLYLGFEREDVIVRRPKPTIQPLMESVYREATDTPPLDLGSPEATLAVPTTQSDESPVYELLEEFAFSRPVSERADGTLLTETNRSFAANELVADPVRRDPILPGPQPGPVYRAANFRMRFRWVDAPVMHDGVRPQGIEVNSLAEIEARFIAAKIEFQRQRGLVPGYDCILVQDPAGNWLELVESRPV